MILADPADWWFPPRDGHVWVWYDEQTEGAGLTWVTPAQGKGRCRFSLGGRTMCGEPAVASLRRGHTRPSWWDYCGDHLYGRRIIDGRVHGMRQVPAPPA